MSDKDPKKSAENPSSENPPVEPAVDATPTQVIEPATPVASPTWWKRPVTRWVAAIAGTAVVAGGLGFCVGSHHAHHRMMHRHGQFEQFGGPGMRMDPGMDGQGPMFERRPEMRRNYQGQFPNGQFQQAPGAGQAPAQSAPAGPAPTANQLPPLPN